MNDKNNNEEQNPMKVMSFSFNPIIIGVIGLVVGLLIYGFFQATRPSGNEIDLNQFVENVKDNKYSDVLIQDTGKAYGYSKNFYIAEQPTNGVNLKDNDVTDVVNASSNEITFVSLDEFTKRIETKSLRDLIQAYFNNSTKPVVKQIIIGDGFAIAKVNSVNGQDFGVKDVSNEALQALFENNSEQLARAYINVVKLRTASKAVDYSLIQTDYSASKLSDVWVFDDQVIAQIRESEIQKEFVTARAPLIDNFAEYFKDAGVEVGDNAQFTIKYESVPRFDGALLLQVLSLVFIGFVVFSVLRGINGSGNKLMQFGESKAKVFFGKKPEVTFKDVAGIDSAKEELNEVVMFLKDPKRFLKLGARIPKGLLMVGSPGTGKTLLARAIAGEAGVPFFHTSGSEFEEMLVGAGASRVRDLFAKAKKASPALIFIDEIDAVARKRGTTIQSSSTEQTLNQILVEMDGFEKNVNVIVIAATNRPDVLDPAILRPGRFDRRIVIDLPDINGREAILKIHAANKPLAADLDLKKVARRTVGYSGADLENVLNEAAIIVAKENGTEITYHDIEEAATRVGMGRERKLERTDEEVKRTAYHEVGHAIIAKLTPNSDPVHRVTVVSRGMALGVTMQLPERDKYSQSLQEMQSRLKVLMGGRAAEEIMYGGDHITSGASNDIEQATSLARRMVKQFGFSKKLGMVKYGESNELQYLGYGYGEQQDYSNDTAKIIDEEVREIIDAAYIEAKKIIIDNKELFEKISKDLLQKEVLEGEDFEKYFEA